jgi:hypothetical protein
MVHLGVSSGEHSCVMSIARAWYSLRKRPSPDPSDLVHFALSPIDHLSFAYVFSCPDQSIEQGPGKHKSTEPPKHFAQPHVAQRPVKVRARLPICFEREQ